MRTMFDAVDVRNIPDTATMVACYVDGLYRNVDQARERFPDAQLVTITVTGRMGATIGDCETGDLTPTSAAQAVRDGMIQGVYMNSSTWPQVEQAMGGVIPPAGYWVAQYDNDPNILSEWVKRGCYAKQYQSTTYDTSSVLGFWPGVDGGRADMDMVIDANGGLYVAAASPQGHLLVFNAAAGVGGAWSVTDVTDKIEAEVPGSAPYLVQP